MCGIFALLNNDSNFSDNLINEQFMKGNKRGPEFSKIQSIYIKTIFGFHRLAINGLNNESNQPLIIDNITLICNGEIYNYQELYSMMNVTPQTDSDCEVIIHLYKKYGISQTLQMLDGVFSFALFENADIAKMYIARDPYGVRPLYVLKPNVPSINNNVYGFASEMKVLIELCKEQKLNSSFIEHFKPGTYSMYVHPFKVSSLWVLEDECEYVNYHSAGFQTNMYLDETHDYKYITMNNIQYYLSNAVKKRTLVTDRPIACLLSGGLDSSLITALVNEFHKQISTEPLETYSIGLEGSDDLKYARIVADYLGTNHTEIKLTEKDFLDVIPEVIYTIESYDTTSVRASIGNYLLGKYISEHSEAKVIFNGDGSDELCGGYLYMHLCPDPIEFDKECRRLLKDIHAFDVLRSDKCISSHGLEPRTPFLDRTWVQYYLNIDPKMRFHPGNNECEKFLLRTAFSSEYFLNRNGTPLLPDEILWRRKEAFSDGVSKKCRSLYEIIQDHVVSLKLNKSISYFHNNPDTDEKYYYRTLFESYYPNMGNIVPYFWMPSYVNASDASARTLDIYNNNNNMNNIDANDINLEIEN